jgi:methylmalonyl-CoA mutase
MTESSPAPSSAREAEWQALVAEALKGARFDSLRSTTYDGIVMEPLYARAKNESVIPGRIPGQAWTVMQRADLSDPEAANAQILDDLNNGANGLTLVFPGAVGDRGYTLQPTEDAIARTLEGVHFDAGIDLELDFGPPSREVASFVASLVKRNGVAPGTVSIRFGFDSLGAFATTGSLRMPWPDLAPVVTSLISGLAAQGFVGPFAAADGRAVHAAGGSEAQELAFSLTCAVEYLRAMEAGGIALDDAERFIFFRLAADQDQFLTMAKFRALRKLWARVEAACGLAPRPAFISAETAWRMLTRRDPHGNIVRGTIATLAAALGGADAVTVLPFTAALGTPDAFARRIARSTQMILIEESNLHRVADPAAGAGAVEALTDALCLAGWKLFQQIEQAGGAAEALAAGLIQREVARVRAAREADVARRKVSIIGTSDFPNLDEEPANVLAVSHGEPPPASGALAHFRLAQPFERLRDLSDDYVTRQGTRPKVFLACLGRAADFNARASFAKSLFEAGGIEAVEGSGENLVKGFKESGAKLACLCSSDKVYARDAADVAKALASAGARHVYLAGKPGNQDALVRAGVGTFLYQGCDTLDLLHKAYERLGK